MNYEVTGVLARGDADFVWRKSCYAVKRCKAKWCNGEDVTDASRVLIELAKTGQVTPP